MNLLETLRPLKNIREMFQEFSSGNIRGGITNYLEALPGVTVAGKLMPHMVSKLVNPHLATPINNAITASVKWFQQPAKAMGKLSIATGKSAAGTVKAAAVKPATLAALKVGGTLALGAALEHGVSRILKNRISTIDLIRGLTTGKGSQYVQDQLNSKLTWKDWVFGMPINELILKNTKQGKQIMKGGK